MTKTEDIQQPQGVRSLVSHLWDCPTPSAYAIEFYGQHGGTPSLDAVLYACPFHCVVPERAVEDCGKRPVTASLDSTDVHPPCGRRFDVAMHRAAGQLAAAHGLLP